MSGLRYKFTLEQLGMTQEEMDELSRQVREVLMNYDDIIPIVPIPPHHYVGPDNTVKVLNMCRKRDLELERLIRETRHRAFMKAYILPAVRHYRVKRE